MTNYIDATVYGVSGNGSDQTLGVQKAWAAAKAKGAWTGNTIMLPAGVIAIKPGVLDLSGDSQCYVSMKGQGMAATVFRLLGAGNGLVIRDVPHSSFDD